MNDRLRFAYFRWQIFYEICHPLVDPIKRSSAQNRWQKRNKQPYSFSCTAVAVKAPLRYIAIKPLNARWKEKKTEGWTILKTKHKKKTPTKMPAFVCAERGVDAASTGLRGWRGEGQCEPPSKPATTLVHSKA